MGWPKGMPRKGYIKKDGNPHLKHGERFTTLLSGTRTLKDTSKPASRRVRKVDPALFDAAPEKGPVFHGAVGSSPITEPCPQCLYAYADGGYCPDCGWMMPITITPYAGEKVQPVKRTRKSK